MSNHHPINFSSLGDAHDTARDPVCKAEVDIDGAFEEESYGGLVYYFCSDECAELFRMSPESYVPRIAQA